MEKARRNKRKNNQKFYFAGVRPRPPGGLLLIELEKNQPLSPATAEMAVFFSHYELWQ
jgi:hypothetical protein